MILKKFKIYFIIAGIFAVAIGSWSARGWYEDGKIVDALERQKKQYEKQADADAKSLEAALTEQEDLRVLYEDLKNDASKISLCTNGGNDFLRLFNRSAIAANPKR